MKALNYLTLFNASMTDDDFKQLARLNQVTHLNLNLRGTRITGAFFCSKNPG
jgi:hypothetical protein